MTVTSGATRPCSRFVFYLPLTPLSLPPRIQSIMQLSESGVTARNHAEHTGSIDMKGGHVFIILMPLALCFWLILSSVSFFLCSTFSGTFGLGLARGMGASRVWPGSFGGFFSCCLFFGCCLLFLIGSRLDVTGW